ncbi:MAG: hypothetical protein KAI97_06450 [Gemmatimonadetes bacterium]|nr:hypothetical protein [Gemmatimonadota bacterium]
MNAKMIHADNRLRVYTAIALVVIIVCGFVTYDWTQRALAEIEKLAQYDRQLAFDRAASFLKMAAAVVGVTTALVGVSEARKARRSLATGEWPPPGTRVLMDTPVVEGGPARRRAKFVIALSMAMLTIALGLQVFAWLLVRSYTTQP